MIQNDGDQYGYKNIKNALLERTASENVIVEYRSGIFSIFIFFVNFITITIIITLPMAAFFCHLVDCESRDLGMLPKFWEIQSSVEDFSVFR